MEGEERRKKGNKWGWGEKGGGKRRDLYTASSFYSSWLGCCGVNVK